MWRCLFPLAAVAGIAICFARAADKPNEAVGKGKLVPRYTSAVSCTIQCHGLSQPLEDRDLPPVCRCVESNIWEGNGKDLPGDKHRDAYDLLSSPRAAEMKRLLKRTKEPKDDPTCLGCHGFTERDKSLLDRPDKVIAEGVTCVVCHGAYKNWVPEHHGSNDVEVRKRWRALSRSVKEAEYGMRDLWDPASRARLCASCHVGSAAEGRVLTHEMYAAGHPPLPGFEPAKFSEAMRHWQYRAEKPAEVQKILGYQGGEKERAHLAAVGGVVTFESAMRLLADEAKACATNSRSLDVAHFDCAACHHDLRSPSWRQQRGYGGGAPGRPTAPVWPSALLRAAAGHADGYDRVGESLKEYEERSARLKKVFGDRPFGTPELVAEEAGKLADWAAALAKRVGAKEMNEAAARRFLRALCDLPPGELPDYDSARQVAWAAEMVAADLDAKPKALTALDGELRLALPGGRKQSIVDQLGEALKVRARYEPQTFRKQIADVSESLK
jgi:hypothetical protein